MARAPKRKRTFHEELVLNRWMLGHFTPPSLAALKDRLGDDRHEGIDDDGQTRFFHALTRDLFDLDRIDAATLRRYDLNIVAHWTAITQRRNAADGVVLTMKYFQYLSLLFTEIYLDAWFNRRQALLDGLNGGMAAYRAEDGAEPFRDYGADDLNKLAYWNATGSGKTLLLHVNIKQYLHYFQAGRANVWPDRIILLTPNEGLSRQHLDELRLSGLQGHAFDKTQSGSLFKGWVDVIEVTKLADEMGDRTVATDAFEGDNLVLVDEGHRGAGSAGGVWMARRAALVRGGFAFEYSATFSQSVAKGAIVAKAEEDILKAKARRLFDRTPKQLDDAERAGLTLTAAERARAKIEGVREAYAKAVLIDYSYKFFYADGYGKESLILNLKDDSYAVHGPLYFTACLLSFYQQLWLWDTHRDAIAEFNIAKPLWVFVGNTVGGEDSDVLSVVRSLARFLRDSGEAIGWIGDLVADRARLLDAKGDNIFAGRFAPLMQRDATAIYDDILRRLFHADARQTLKLVNIKSSKGELALRVGAARPFGVINIGDDAGFFRTAEAAGGVDTEGDDFGSGLFDGVNLVDSPVNVLIGSRKFTEGWSSWRVSTMGLLNMGTGEGSQIIQLFGRGVRLKGRGMSLKRSLPNERPRGVHLERLETLNIFGVRANYMATFKDYLREEGVTPGDEIIALDFPTRATLPRGKRLKTLKLKDGYKDNQARGFKRTQFPCLFETPAEFMGRIKPPHVVLDLYPRLEALDTRATGAPPVAPDVRHRGKLDRAAMALFDWDAVFLAVQDHKLKTGMSNLRLDRQRLIDFCTRDDGWYTLHIPAAKLRIAGFADIVEQQAILVRLLLDFTDRFYRALKGGYEGQFYDIVHVDEGHGSMLKLYQFEIDATDTGREYEGRLKALQALIVAGDLRAANAWHAGQTIAICFAGHLYQPLFNVPTGAPLRMRPLAFDAPSEVRFVRDLEAFCASAGGKEALRGCSLYLLRNADTRAKGLGFALAGNFYPDFLLWLVDDATGRQWLNFVDPKGIRNLPLSDPKFGLYSEVKERERALGDPALTLNAFILAETAHRDLVAAGSREDFEDRNVLFMDPGGDEYLPRMMTRIFA